MKRVYLEKIFIGEGLRHQTNVKVRGNRMVKENPVPIILRSVKLIPHEDLQKK